MIPSPRRAARREPGPLALLEAILRDRPNLPDAACIGRHHLFDAADEGDTQAKAEARALCARCPERGRCSERADT